ncbi:MAG TPA: L-aspartate oxidase [Caulobacteraceae bacterium]|nr:L-aspartate oxidase [Caulobacteraceae bacterium]
MAFRRALDGVLVIGAGLAGLSAALAAAPRRALVISAAPLGAGCASRLAQGGMAAALAEDDDPALHAADTLAAGAGLCDPEAVAALTREGPAAVERLAALGAPFDRDEAGGFLQGLEAAHCRPRIAKVGGDGAGAAILQAVAQAARSADHIEVWENVRAVSLLTGSTGEVRGALVRSPAGEAFEIVAAATILATGGAGGLYAVTTNPPAARGEGLALAALAGARLRDLEFVQFHPTAMALGVDPAPLATEALRGEGATLINAAGERFMERTHPLAELAPRDIVARAVAAELAAGRGAWLDGREHPGAAFPSAFPAVFAACAQRGLDPRGAPIPIAPAAHYHMGGVATDLFGRTSLPGLFAVGECAATGAHGANRLASNSLLEAAVFGERAGRAAAEAPFDGVGALTRAPLAELPPEPMAELRQRMSAAAGVVREGAPLARLCAWIETARARYGPAAPLIAAGLIAEAALARRESRGAHFRADFPEAAATAASSRRSLHAPLANAA